MVFTPEELGLTEAACKPGYTSGPDCCTYYQCTGIGSAVPGSIRLVKRRCVWPLVWNEDSCSCDWDVLVPQCVDDPCQIESIVPTVADCPDPGTLNNSSECCVDGVVYTKTGDESYIRGNDEIPQDCPEGHEFMVESCSCEHITGQFGDRYCLVWDFENDFIDIHQEIPAFVTNVYIAKGEGVGGGNAARFREGGSLHISAFQKGYFGRKFSIGMSVKDESGEGGILFDNAGTLHLQLSNGMLSGGVKTVLDDTVDDFNVPVPSSTGNRKKRQGGAWSSFGYEHGSLHVYVNGILVANPDQPLAPVQGTGCALTIGSNFTGLIDNFFFCPFELTDEERQKVVGNGTFPTRDGNLNVKVKSGANNGENTGDSNEGTGGSGP
ncbi:unnamed protein product [Owenia fusiformis]|uniref:Chitin-binding type-2 domain-containing protein n=1 Tax=Owenia fusiformis TaxID=6347 RepID=A0A8S4NSB8_OWEFU|nr:unnamed protein product [Owenia fusiformis]